MNPTWPYPLLQRRARKAQSKFSLILWPQCEKPCCHVVQRKAQNWKFEELIQWWNWLPSFFLLLGLHTVAPPTIPQVQGPSAIQGSSHKLRNHQSHLLPVLHPSYLTCYQVWIFPLYISEIYPLLSAPLSLTTWLNVFTWQDSNRLTGLLIYVLSSLQSILSSAAQIIFQNKNLVKFPTQPCFYQNPSKASHYF